MKEEIIGKATFDAFNHLREEVDKIKDSDNYKEIFHKRGISAEEIILNDFKRWINDKYYLVLILDEDITEYIQQLQK